MSWNQNNYDKEQNHTKPRTPEQVLKRIMNDFSKHQSRAKDAYDVTGEMPKYFFCDYEEMRRIVQNNFAYLGVKIREWKKKNT